MEASINISTGKDSNKEEEVFTRNDDIDNILEKEMCARDAYDQVLDKIKDEPEKIRLNQLKADHDMAVGYWKRQSQREGSLPKADPGIWGNVVEAFVGLSKLTGEDNALRTLKKGEEYALHSYKKLLESDKLSIDQKREVRDKFIPAQRNHIQAVDSLIAS